MAFTDRNYKYGEKRSRLIETCGTFSEVDHMCAGVADKASLDLQLATPIACVFVYYPRGTSVLNMLHAQGW